MRVLVVIAACNDAPSLDQFLPRLMQVVRSLMSRSAVLVIDDGSLDSTVEISRKHGCLVLRNRENKGIGTSLRRGYRKAMKDGYDAVATMDADGQHDENFLVPMLKRVKHGADIVLASRYHPDSERIQVPIDRDFLNVAVTAQMRIATGWEITDPLSGFWVIRRHCLEFALKHGHQARYGIHIEHLVKFWYLANPQPRLVEVAHPAIYGNHGTLPLLTREYSASNKETRVDRFGTHALHILQAIEDVNRLRPGVADAEMTQRRKHKK